MKIEIPKPVLTRLQGSPSIPRSLNGFRVSGLGFRVYGLGFRGWGLGFRVTPPNADSLKPVPSGLGVVRGGGGRGVGAWIQEPRKTPELWTLNPKP